MIWAIGGPLTRVSQGSSRSLAVYRMPSSGRSEGRICRIPKLIVRGSIPVTRSNVLTGQRLAGTPDRASEPGRLTVVV
jgi:hypothetical protein